MLGEFPGYARHVRWTPGEYPPVLKEELDERAFLCRVEGGRHQGCLGGVGWVHLVRRRAAFSVELDGAIAALRWEPQEEGVMSTAASFPSERNQG